MNPSSNTAPSDPIGLLSVALALPRGRASVGELAARFGIDPPELESRLGLVEKPVASGDDEHPSDLAVRAVQSALDACGATADDVGLVIYGGTSRDYLPSWTLAIDLIGRLGMKRAVGYDLSLGCAAPVVALGHALRPPVAVSAPLIVIASAERWTHTLSPGVPFPLQLLAHGDGGAACVVGPGSHLLLTLPSVRMQPQYNGRILIPAGGTREPLSEEALAAGRHYRTGLRHEEGLAERYVEEYVEVIRATLEEASRPAVDLLIMNQVRPAFRERIRQSLGLSVEAMVDTYPRLGHIGGADIFAGLASAARNERLVGTVVVASSAVSAFAATALTAVGPGPVRLPVGGDREGNGVSLPETPWRGDP